MTGQAPEMTGQAPAMTGQAPAKSPMRAAVTVVAGFALAGVVVGALWAWLAPAIHGIIALTRSGDRVHAYLGNESDHWFTAAALMVGFGSVLAVIGVALVWQWRAHRGPVQAVAVIVGSITASAAAVGVAAVAARWRYGAIDLAAAPVSPENRVYYVVEAPSVFFGHTPLDIAVTVLLPAAVAATVYLLCAVSSPRDDLGGWPPIEYPAAVTGRTATAADGPPAAPSSPLP